MAEQEVDAVQRDVLVVRDSEQLSCSLKWAMRPDRTYWIVLDGPVGTINGAGNDLFEALQEIRRELELRGWLVAVQGARKDTYPTGMVRDMIGARRVYVLQLGSNAEREWLVDIFADADVESLATVEQQKDYYRDWRLSLRR
jgi:hypothetical protein